MSPVSRWKIVALLLGLGCIALAYRVFDQGITRTYLDSSQEAFASHIRLLTSLVEHEWLGLTEEQVMSRLKAYVASQPADSIVLKRDPEKKLIYLDGVRFEFTDEKLTKITAQ